MKLKDILTLTYDLENIVVYEEGEDEAYLYKGVTLKVPWYLAEAYLDRIEGISIMAQDGVMESAIKVTVSRREL